MGANHVHYQMEPSWGCCRFGLFGGPAYREPIKSVSAEVLVNTDHPSNIYESQSHMRPGQLQSRQDGDQWSAYTRNSICKLEVIG